MRISPSRGPLGSSAQVSVNACMLLVLGVGAAVLGVVTLGRQPAEEASATTSSDARQTAVTRACRSIADLPRVRCALDICGVYRRPRLWSSGGWASLPAGRWHGKRKAVDATLPSWQGESIPGMSGHGPYGRGGSRSRGAMPRVLASLSTVRSDALLRPPSSCEIVTWCMPHLPASSSWDHPARSRASLSRSPNSLRKALRRTRDRIRNRPLTNHSV